MCLSVWGLSLGCPCPLPPRAARRDTSGHGLLGTRPVPVRSLARRRLDGVRRGVASRRRAHVRGRSTAARPPARPRLPTGRDRRAPDPRGRRVRGGRLHRARAAGRAQPRPAATSSTPPRSRCAAPCVGIVPRSSDSTPRPSTRPGASTTTASPRPWPRPRGRGSASSTAPIRSSAGDDELVGYAICGRAGRIGYLQRLAVHPVRTGRRARPGTRRRLPAMASTPRWAARHGQHPADQHPGARPLPSARLQDGTLRAHRPDPRAGVVRRARPTIGLLLISLAGLAGWTTPAAATPTGQPDQAATQAGGSAPGRRGHAVGRARRGVVGTLRRRRCGAARRHRERVGPPGHLR